MNTQHTLSRRTFLHASALGAITILGASALPHARTVLADSGPGQYICDYNNVRLRETYGLSGRVLGVLNVGDVVDNLGESADADGYTWIKVSVTATGTVGWTALEFFSPVLGTIIWPVGTAVHVASNNVNLRTGPGLGYAVIGNYNTGTTATIVAGPEESDGYSWHKIDINGTVGWMATDFLAEGAGNDGGSGSGWAAGTTVHVTSDNVNMRSGAGLDHSVLAVFSTGSTGTITAGPFPNDGYTWYELRIDGAAGYMVDEFLAEGAGSGTGNGFPAGASVRVTTDLNLRTDPGTDAAIVATYGPSDIATIIAGPIAANGYDWYQVELWSDTNVGWFAGEYLELARFEPTGSRLRVVDGPLNLRTGGGLDYAVVASLAEGTVVVVKDASLGEADGYTWMWVYVEDNPDLTGWIAAGFTVEL